MGAVMAFEDIGGPLIANAAAKLDAARAEEERAARRDTVSRPVVVERLARCDRGDRARPGARHRSLATTALASLPRGGNRLRSMTMHT